MKDRNANRPGYKETKVGWIPEEWEVIQLKKGIKGSGKYGINASSVRFDSTLPTYLRITDIDNSGNFIEENKRSVDHSDAHKYVLKENDIVFARTGATVGKTYLYNEEDGELIYAGFLIKFSLNPNLLQPIYFKLFTETEQYEKYVTVVSMRSGQPGINKSEYGKLKIPLPPLPEQKKIAEILSTWDKVIEQTRSLIKAKKKRKKGLMQQLLTGKTRLPGFATSVNGETKFKETKVGWIPEEWECQPFANVFNRVSLPLNPIDTDTYQEIGIRSHGKGIFYKAPVKGIDIGFKRVFHCQPGALVFNIVFAWEQAVGVLSKQERDMIASHRFPMYKGKNGQAYEPFFLFFFKTRKGKYGLNIASPGGAGRNKTLGQRNLKYLYVPKPHYPEQKAITEVLSTADDEIALLEETLASFEKQKRGLMQKLLTGEVRVFDVG